MSRPAARAALASSPCSWPKYSSCSRHGHPRIQAALLRHVAEAQPLLQLHRPPKPQHLAAIDLDEPEDRPHRGRLPRPVRAEESEHPPRLHREREVGEGLHGLEPLAHMDEAETVLIPDRPAASTTSSRGRTRSCSASARPLSISVGNRINSLLEPLRASRVGLPEPSGTALIVAVANAQRKRRAARPFGRCGHGPVWHSTGSPGRSRRSSLARRPASRARPALSGVVPSLPDLLRVIQGARRTSRTDTAPTAIPTAAIASRKPSPVRGSRSSRSAACSSR